MPADDSALVALVSRMERDGRAHAAMVMKDALAGDLPLSGPAAGAAYVQACLADLEILVQRAQRQER